MDPKSSNLKTASRYLSNLRKPKLKQVKTRNASKTLIQVSHGRDFNIDSELDSKEDIPKIKIPPFIESSIDQFSVENMNRTGAQMSQRNFTIDQATGPPINQILSQASLQLALNYDNSVKLCHTKQQFEENSKKRGYNKIPSIKVSKRREENKKIEKIIEILKPDDDLDLKPKNKLASLAAKDHIARSTESSWFDDPHKVRPSVMVNQMKEEEMTREVTEIYK